MKIRNFMNWFGRSGKLSAPAIKSHTGNISIEILNETGIWRTGLPVSKGPFLARWHNNPSDEFWTSGLFVSFVLPESRGVFDYLESEAMLNDAD